MELINEWDGGEHIGPRNRQGARLTEELGDLSGKIGKELSHFEPLILSVQFYEDVGYPWIRVTCAATIDPRFALDIGDAIAKAAGGDRVFFNSLHPRAIYFLLDPALDPPTEPGAALQYGERLVVMRRSWAAPAQS